MLCSDSHHCSTHALRLLHDDQKDSGVLPVLGHMIRSYNVRWQSRRVAGDLVEAVHVVLRMYDRLNADERGAFLVARRAARRRTRKARLRATPVSVFLPRFV